VLRQKASRKSAQTALWFFAGVFSLLDMLASLVTTLWTLGLSAIIAAPWTLAVFAFQIWMFVHAIRNGEYIWAAFILLGWGASAILYYFLVYRASPSSTQGFELPGAFDRRRIRELESKIHHLDNAHHHSQLGDLYFQKGKLEQAEQCYREALARDGTDIDTRSHMGQCLLRQKKAAEARPYLESVVTENPKHDYGYTLMALAEDLTALGETENALEVWKRVTANNSYPRAKVQLAALLMRKGDKETAGLELREVLADDAHAPVFQRKRDRFWVRRARTLMKKL
jgi:tetratricopeptide (TPR) repeat protein